MKLFFLKYFTMFFNLSSNVSHKSTYARQSLSDSLLVLFRTTKTQILLAALLAMPALASSSARSSLIIVHSCCMLLSQMSCCRCFISYLTTALEHLYLLRAVCKKTQGTWHGALLARFALGGDDFRPMTN